jgi:CRISPR system Cascade subunit CasA
MSLQFNLVTDPWVPVIEAAGGPLRVRSLADVLSDASALREIWSPSPLETIALHRLALAVLHAALRGPANVPEGRALLRDGWPGTDVGDYLERWRSRFGLFDPQRPFFQYASVPDSKVSPVTRLAHERASANNPTLFDHSRDGDPPLLAPDAAARLLVAHQLYALGGGVNKPFNLSHGPMAGKLSVIVLGENLRTTLAANLVRYGDDLPMPMDDDAPVWEQKALAQPDRNGTFPRGYLDYLTWQSRAIKLRPNADGTVSTCEYRQNLKLTSDVPPDPLVPYRRDLKRGFLAVEVRRGRALWRDAHAIIAGTLEGSLRAVPNGVLAWLSEIAEPDTRPRGLIAGGIASNQARVEHWVMGRLPVSTRLLHDDTVRGALAESIARAEQGGQALGRAARRTATLLVAPASDEPGAPRPDTSVIAPVAESLGAHEIYWAALEPAFDVLARELGGTPDIEAIATWTTAVRDTARAAFVAAVRQLDGSARSLRASAGGERVLAAELSKLNPAPQEAST